MQCNKMVITFTDCFFNCQTSAKYVQLNIFSLEYVFHYDGYCLFCVILQRTLSHHLLYIFAKVARLCHKKKVARLWIPHPSRYLQERLCAEVSSEEGNRQTTTTKSLLLCLLLPTRSRKTLYIWKTITSHYLTEVLTYIHDHWMKTATQISLFALNILKLFLLAWASFSFVLCENIA